MNQKMAGLLRAMRLKRRVGTTRDRNVWVFSSTDNIKFNYNAKYLFLYVKEHCSHIHPLYVMNDAATREALAARYGAEYFVDTVTDEGICRVLQAAVWVTSAGLPVYGFGMAKRRLVVNLWHGIPLKTIALRDPSETFLSRLYFRKIFSDNYTDVVTTSTTVGDIMAESLGVPANRIRIWGQPRCDGLYEPFDKAGYLRVKYGAEVSFERAILYAPTFRSGEPGKLFPFPDFDVDRMEDFLANRKILLCIRMHLQDTTDATRYLRPHIRLFNEDLAEDVMEGMPAFDLLVTDYSSIYFDYLLLDRPMIFLPYDLEEYERVHGFNFAYNRVTPGPKPQKMAAFFEAIDEGLAEDPYRAQREEAMPLFYKQNGPCSQRICDGIEHRLEELFS